MFAIYDSYDKTYHQGGGDWKYGAVETAEKYATEGEARAALDDVDCEKILRWRLRIVTVGVPESEWRKQVEQEAFDGGASKPMAAQTAKYEPAPPHVTRGL